MKWKGEALWCFVYHRYNMSNNIHYFRFYCQTMYKQNIHSFSNTFLHVLYTDIFFSLAHLGNWHLLNIWEIEFIGFFNTRSIVHSRCNNSILCQIKSVNNASKHRLLKRKQLNTHIPSWFYVLLQDPDQIRILWCIRGMLDMNARFTEGSAIPSLDFSFACCLLLVV